MTNAQRQSRFAVILAFGLVYFFWGSTYLAIDIAVERIPPALMCGIAFSIAACACWHFAERVGERLVQPAPVGADGDRRRALADGRESHPFLCGKVCGVRLGGVDRCRDSALVPGAGYAAAWRSSCFVAR